MSELPNIDIDSLETQEWLESMESVLENEGPERAHYLLEKLIIQGCNLFDNYNNAKLEKLKVYSLLKFISLYMFIRILESNYF